MTKDELASVAKAMSAMFQCFPQSVLADPDLQLRGYIAAVEEYDVADILTACRKFIQGNVEEHNKAFCPSSAQLCAEVRERRSIRELLAKREARLSLVKA